MNHHSKNFHKTFVTKVCFLYRLFIRQAMLAVRSFRVPLARKQFLQASSKFYFSSDSHDDFKSVKKTVPSDKSEVLKLIESQVKENSVMLYMKGTPSRPQCGFSSQAVRILNAVGVDFSSVNVLEYQAIREGVKEYSQWPTLPQLFVKGEFIGGCDILTSMYTSGELATLLKKEKLISE